MSPTPPSLLVETVMPKVFCFGCPKSLPSDDAQTETFKASESCPRCTGYYVAIAAASEVIGPLCHIGKVLPMYRGSGKD